MNKAIKFFNDYINLLADSILIATDEEQNAQNKQTAFIAVKTSHKCMLIEKHLQALDTIEIKDVNIQRLRKCINVTAYNNGLPKKRQLTLEEFVSLNEVLE